MDDGQVPAREGGLAWRDLACLPWWIWYLGGALGVVARIPRRPDDTDIVMPALLTAIAVLPGLVLIWLYRRSWLIRRGWWIPLLAFGLGAVALSYLEA